MIKNISYNRKQAKDEINSMVGESYSWFDRIKMGGDGSPRFKVVLSSRKIKKILLNKNSDNYCNIELRPKGIIVSFQSILGTYAWVIPYYQLTIFKSEDYYSIYGAWEFIRIEFSDDSLHQTFIEKLLEIRSAHFQQLALLN